MGAIVKKQSGLESPYEMRGEGVVHGRSAQTVDSKTPRGSAGRLARR